MGDKNSGQRLEAADGGEEAPNSDAEVDGVDKEEGDEEGEDEDEDGEGEDNAEEDDDEDKDIEGEDDEDEASGEEEFGHDGEDDEDEEDEEESGKGCCKDWKFMDNGGKDFYLAPKPRINLVQCLKSLKPKTELSLQKEQLQLKIIEIEDEAEKWQKEKDRIKSFTTNEKAILEQNFRDLVRDLEKQKEEVRAALEQREQDAVDQVKVIVDALDERAKVLHEDKQTREQLHSISDSVLFLQEFGALMSNYSLPPPLPTYHVLLEGEGLGQSLGNFKDDLLNVCMRHVEKMCKADLSRNFIERNHMENGGDHRYMNSYTSSYGNEWSTPDTMKRYSMYLTPKGEGEHATNGRGPKSPSDRVSGRLFSGIPELCGASAKVAASNWVLGNYTSRVWEYSSTVQNSEDLPTVPGNSSFSLKGYPSILRSQASKAQPQTWKSGKQTLLSHYRPFYVNKGSGIGSNEAP
ncbi:tripartite motif-containing protein 29 [Cricetulus griseus]|uniref:Tripartite motif-containing protein 29 n=1 Tax=Cricetulus griseus TaxID=10029 RepID=A0A061I9H0_CRIGR|nr:tripartite motif-containing protein 29 [Cricetulus griseus]